MDKVIVVGAGPAGLATAAQLRRAHVPAIVLEQADAIARAAKAVPPTRLQAARAMR